MSSDYHQVIIIHNEPLIITYNNLISQNIITS